MLGTLVAFLVPALGVAGADEASPPGQGTPARAALVEPWSDLCSPWHEVRLLAERRLRHLPPEDARPVAAALAGSERVEFRRAFAEWVRFRFERPGAVPPGAFERDQVVERIVREADPGVVDRLVEAAARDGEVVRRLQQAAAEGRLSEDRLDRIVAARLVLLLEDVMHEGRVPGFFDGQFAALHALDGSAYERLLGMALDPRITFVVRALSVMALHEARRPTLEAELQPLFVKPTFEYEYPNGLFRRARIDETDVLVYCACRLSQYARFSCAKAGQPRPIREKIETLESIAAQRLRRAEMIQGAPLDRLGDERLYFLEEAMDAYFELGYHHQQLDDYVRAELEYRTITERPEELRVKIWAYYNLACIRAVQGRTDEAIAELGRAVGAGFTDVSWARRDGDLASLRDDPRFARVLQRAAEGGAPLAEPGGEEAERAPGSPDPRQKEPRRPK